MAFGAHRLGVGHQLLNALVAVVRLVLADAEIPKVGQSTAVLHIHLALITPASQAPSEESPPWFSTITLIW